MRIDVVAVALGAVLVAQMSLDAGAPRFPARAQEPTAELGALEQRLLAEPDSLEAGNQYRLEVIRARKYDRCLAFFAQLVADYPDAANAHLNYGFAYVDKIPTAGSITQVILANNALTEFTRALELRPTWLAYYTRGNSYLFWPTILGRAPLGVADLERALEIQRGERRRGYHVRAFIALGDGYWKVGRVDRARELWTEGARLFPDDARLNARLSSDGDALKTLIADVFDPGRRVDTDLHELWAQP